MSHDYENGWTENDQLAEDLREAEHYRYLYREVLEKIANGSPKVFGFYAIKMAKEALKD